MKKYVCPECKSVLTTPHDYPLCTYPEQNPCPACQGAYFELVPETEKESKYLYFEEMEAKPKTKQFAVRSKFSSFILGYVKWYAQWRKYCFFIERHNLVEAESLVFDTGCLGDIQDFINKLMSERKEIVNAS